jgi:hypothetical protein
MNLELSAVDGGREESRLRAVEGFDLAALVRPTTVRRRLFLRAMASCLCMK